MAITLEQVGRLEYIREQLTSLRDAFNNLSAFVDTSLANAKSMNESNLEVNEVEAEMKFIEQYMTRLAVVDAAALTVWRYVPPENP